MCVSWATLSKSSTLHAFRRTASTTCPKSPNSGPSQRPHQVAVNSKKGSVKSLSGTGIPVYGRMQGLERKRPLGAAKLRPGRPPTVTPDPGFSQNRPQTRGRRNHRNFGQSASPKLAGGPVTDRLSRQRLRICREPESWCSSRSTPGENVGPVRAEDGQDEQN